MTWYQLFTSEEEAKKAIVHRQAVTVQAGAQKLCVARLENHFFAVANRCPHSGASLGQGSVNAYGEVICPLHHYRYRLLDGAECNERTPAVETFPIEIRDDGVFIGV